MYRPLAAYLIESGGVTYSFVVLGIFFAVVTIIAGCQLAKAPPGYVPPAARGESRGRARPRPPGTLVDWAPSEMLKTWQCYALILMFIGTTQSGLLNHRQRRRPAGAPRPRRFPSSRPTPGSWSPTAVW